MCDAYMPASGRRSYACSVSNGNVLVIYSNTTSAEYGTTASNGSSVTQCGLKAP